MVVVVVRCVCVYVLCVYLCTCVCACASLSQSLALSLSRSLSRAFSLSRARSLSLFICLSPSLSLRSYWQMKKGGGSEGGAETEGQGSNLALPLKRSLQEYADDALMASCAKHGEAAARRRIDVLSRSRVKKSCLQRECTSSGLATGVKVRVALPRPTPLVFSQLPPAGQYDTRRGVRDVALNGVSWDWQVGDVIYDRWVHGCPISGGKWRAPLNEYDWQQQLPSVAVPAPPPS
jgi:hypothetical protein